MDDRYGRICTFSAKQKRLWVSNDSRTTKDNSLLASEIYSSPLEHAHHATRRAWKHSIETPLYQPSQILGVESVNVLVRMNQIGQRFFIHVGWERRLDENTMQ